MAYGSKLSLVLMFLVMYSYFSNVIYLILFRRNPHSVGFILIFKCLL